jgi:hypothetical protein
MVQVTQDSGSKQEDRKVNLKAPSPLHIPVTMYTDLL